MKVIERCAKTNGSNNGLTRPAFKVFIVIAGHGENNILDVAEDSKLSCVTVTRRRAGFHATEDSQLRLGDGFIHSREIL